MSFGPISIRAVLEHCSRALQLRNLPIDLSENFRDPHEASMFPMQR